MSIEFYIFFYFYQFSVSSPAIGQSDCKNAASDPAVLHGVFSGGRKKASFTKTALREYSRQRRIINRS